MEPLEIKEIIIIKKLFREKINNGINLNNYQI